MTDLCIIKLQWVARVKIIFIKSDCSGVIKACIISLGKGIRMCSSHSSSLSSLPELKISAGEYSAIIFSHSFANQTSADGRLASHCSPWVFKWTIFSRFVHLMNQPFVALKCFLNIFPNSLVFFFNKGSLIRASFSRTWVNHWLNDFSTSGSYHSSHRSLTDDMFNKNVTKKCG